MVWIYDQSGNNRYLSNCISNSFPLLQFAIDSNNNQLTTLVSVSLTNSALKHTFTDSLTLSKTVAGVFDFVTSGNYSYFAIGSSVSLGSEMLAKRYSSTLKLNLATYLDQFNVADLAGEAVGVQAFSYSHSANSYQFTLQQEQKTRVVSGSALGFGYPQGASITLGCSALSSDCLGQLNPAFKFYELIIYNQTLALATQQSISRNQRSLLLNRQSQQVKQYAFASYSIRLLNTSVYNGPVMRLKREDGRLADLYTDGLCKEAAIYDITSSTNITDRVLMKTWFYRRQIYLSIWYDQSGNSHNFQQQNANDQLPKVLLFTSDWIPAILVQSGSQISTNLSLPVTDFTVMLQGDFSPTSSSTGQPAFKISQQTDPSLYDSVTMND